MAFGLPFPLPLTLKNKIIIAGSRSIEDPNIVYPILDEYSPYIKEVVCGTAKGVDTIGAQWANDRHVLLKCFPANWHPNGHYDGSAGYKRNVEMGNYADGLIAIWDGYSRGTEHMINIMEKAHKPYVVYNLSRFS